MVNGKNRKKQKKTETSVKHIRIRLIGGCVNHRWNCVSSELSWVEVSRLFLDHGTRVEVSRTTFLVSKCLEIGTEVPQSVLMPKCLVAEMSGNRRNDEHVFATNDK